MSGCGIEYPRQKALIVAKFMGLSPLEDLDPAVEAFGAGVVL